MTHPDVALAIATCVYPAGLKRLLNSIWASNDLPGHTVVYMDGNQGWQRLDQMPKYRDLFSRVDRERLAEVNREVSDYSFLAGKSQVLVIQGAENRGAVAAFNALFATCFSAGFVALVNDDMDVQPGWLSCLVAVMRQYPNCVMAGYSNLTLGRRRGFADIGDECLMGPAPLMRGVYLRELANQRGWVEDPRFKMLKQDIQRMAEPAGRGHDVVGIASPILMSHRWHVSLGDWRRQMIEADHALDLEYSVNLGATGRQHLVGRHRFVKMDPATCAILEEVR